MPPRPCSLRSPKLCELRAQWIGGLPHASLWLAAYPLAVTGLAMRFGMPGFDRMPRKKWACC